MPGSIKALVTPSVMKWAREQAGLDIATAARKINRPVEDIRGWEDKTRQPTLAQARKAAEVYHRSLAVFYLAEPPKGYQTLRDFRHLPSSQRREYGPELALLLRMVEYRQEWLSEWLAAEGMAPLDFVGSASPKTSASELADAIRTRLDVAPEEQMACRTRREALNLWVNKAEEVGINICRQGGIACEEARGFVLTDPYAPFIYINNNDAIVARLFTLAHELAHLWINSPGLSNLEHLGRVGRTEEERIEIFCNRVASFALLDQNTFDTLWASTSKDDAIEERIKAVSDQAKISEDAVARRLLDQGQITVTRYQQLHNAFAERWRRLKDEERAKAEDLHGFPSPHLMRVLRNGRAFTRVVLTSYFDGALSGADASNLLNAKVNHFHKIAEHATLVSNIPGGSWGED